MRLVKISLSTLALTLGLSTMSYAGADLAVVTKQHLDSRGGSDRVSGLQRYEMKGTITRNGESSPMKLWWKYPNKLRVEIGTGDTKTTSIYDGQTAWVIEPGPWGKEPAGMAPGFRELCARQADFGGPLVSPEKKGIKIVPDSKTWGDAGYLFHVERSDGRKDMLLIDPNMRLPKTETYQIDGDSYAEVRYSKYRRSEGFAIPFHVEKFIDGKLVESIDLSEFVIAGEMPDAHFAVKAPKYDGNSSTLLVDLKSLNDLRERFQSDEGRVRMVAFFSPTSAEGRRGFDELRNTLNLIKDERLRAYVVWTGVVDSDTRSAAAARTAECSDPRVTGFWDQNQAAATEWGKLVSGEHPVWNTYFVNGPTATWESKPPVPDHWLQGNQMNASSDGMEKIKTMLAEMPENPKGSKGNNAKR
jgi:hypothetical protein